MTLKLVPVAIDQDAVLRHLQLDPRKPETQATLLICQRYNLDPVLKHVVLISGRPYVTRDGYLHVAHMSGKLDGLEVIDQGEDTSHWWAKVAVYRKDMSRPFTFIGRYPKADAKHMAKYGPEMAIKCAEVMALRRAFDVGGLGAADEQWDSYQPPVEVADEATVGQIRQMLAALDPADAADVKVWWKDQLFPPLNSGRLTLLDAAAVLDHLDGLGVIDAELVEDESSAARPGVDQPTPSEGVDAGVVPDVVDDRASVDRPTPEVEQPPGEDGIADPMTELQSRKLHALLRDVHQAAGPARFPVLSGLLGRDVGSTKEIDRYEASRLIDDLQTEADREAAR